jgi:hypothetical protein
MTATAGSTMLFKEWDSNGVAVAYSPKLSFIMANNLTLTAVFITDPFVSRKGNYIGVFQGEDELRLTNSGMLTLTLKEKGVFSGTLTQGTTTYRLSSQFNGAGIASFSRSGLLPLTLHLDLSGSETNLLAGTVSDGIWSSIFDGARTVYTSANPAPSVGQYTLVLGGDDATIGSGVASLTVATAGGVTISGTLADGTTLSGTGTVCTEGLWPIYVPLNSAKGLLAGWLAFTNTAQGAVSGNLGWMAPSGSIYYKSGFSRTIHGTGSAFNTAAQVLNVTNATVYLIGGNLGSSLSKAVVQSTNNTFVSTGSSTNFTLTIDPATGLATGSFYHPVSGAQTTVLGAVLQDRKMIQGFFLGTNISGTMLLSQ